MKVSREWLQSKAVSRPARDEGAIRAIRKDIGRQGQRREMSNQKSGQRNGANQDPNIVNIQRYPVAAALNTSTEYLRFIQTHQRHPGILRLANHANSGYRTNQTQARIGP